MPTRKHSRRASLDRAPRESFLGLLLDPIDTLTETIYSVLMAMAVTVAYRVFMFADSGSSFSGDYGTRLAFAMLGGALAWGIIDGMLYAVLEVLQRGERLRLLQYIQTAETEESAVAVVAQELDFILEPITSDRQRRMLYLDILEHLRDGHPQPVRLQRGDLLGALASVLVAVVAVLPSLVPFVLLPRDTALAIRLSNVVSFVVLFGAGYSWGKHTYTNPWRTGLFLATFGLVMVLIAILLGG